MLHFKIGDATGDEKNSDEYLVDLPQLSEKDIFRIESIVRKYEITDLAIDDIIAAYDEELSTHKNIRLSKKEKKTYAKILSALTDNALGPIQFLLQDDEIEEIMVNGLKKPIYIFHRKNGMQKTNLSFESADYFTEVANRALRTLGRRVDERTQRNHGILENNDRISVMIPPYAKEHTLAIRRFSVKPFTMADLVKNKMISARDAAKIWALVERGGVNIGVVGNTGAGKTTFLNAMLRFVDKSARVVCVEETPEIRPPQNQVVQLISNQRLSLRDAIADTLRLRPDRVIVGEVRTDAEVKALIESCLSGQALGTYFTYHGENAKFALQRMRGQGVREDDLAAIDVLIVCKRSAEKRKVTRKVTELFMREGFKPKLKGISKKKKFLEQFKGDDAAFVKGVAKVGA